MRPAFRREVGFAAVAYLVAALLIVGAIALREAHEGDAFDPFRWERQQVPNKWLALLGVPLRDEPPPDEALRVYFTARGDRAGVRHLENTAEAAIEGRIDAVLASLGVGGRMPLPGSVWPPVDIELDSAPRVLVVSPRARIERERADLLRPGLTAADAERIEAETDSADRVALVVPSGGVALYPAVVSDRGTYSDTVATAAHEWVHHYLTFYLLGRAYFTSTEAQTLNETVADIVGDEVGALVVARWGDPTGAVPPSPVSPEPTAIDAVLRDLRLEVDRLLEDGRIAEAEARMAQVRQELAGGGVTIRKVNQAYFAWYGTYAARPDATDPVGAQLRELRQRTGSVAAFLETVRGLTSRAEVKAALERVRGSSAG